MLKMLAPIVTGVVMSQFTKGVVVAVKVGVGVTVEADVGERFFPQASGQQIKAVSKTAPNIFFILQPHPQTRADRNVAKGR